VAAGGPGGYHLEYGYSCMGYEIAGGLGVKLARRSARSS
jgi:3D-(3,5/4)-trihydroxycyclohexane-1,2-dione acylhydrolase (decyclizing)